MFLRRIAALTPDEFRRLSDAFLMLVRVRLMLSVLPWRQVAASVPRSSLAPSIRPDVDRLEWAVRATSRFVPRATCLTQALALQRLLSRYGYDSIVQVGVRNANGPFGAHAWVEHRGRPLLSSAEDITGYSQLFSLPRSRVGLVP